MATPVKKPIVRKKKKEKKVITSGIVFINATYNNTIITVADLQGNVLAWSSSGHLGFKGPKKATPYASRQVVKSVMDKLEGRGLKEVNVLVKGVGMGREAAIRALTLHNLAVNSIKDLTPIPHNGCRPPRPRRV